MQIDFKNKQEKKDIQQETIANGETSDESESQYTASNNLQNKTSFHHQRPMKSKAYVRTQNYSKDSRGSNIMSNDSRLVEMSHRSKHKL